MILKEKEVRSFQSTKRLTKDWTDTLEQAYGEIGAKGKQGEDWLKQRLIEKGFEVETHDNDKAAQLAGIDLTATLPSTKQTWTIDVKTNIKDDGTFFIETNSNGWLLHPHKKSTYIWHVNPKTGCMVWYNRKLMQNFILQNRDKNKSLLKCNANTIQSEIFFVKTNLF
jgi:hypothetical protein